MNMKSWLTKGDQCAVCIYRMQKCACVCVASSSTKSIFWYKSKTVTNTPCMLLHNIDLHMCSCLSFLADCLYWNKCLLSCRCTHHVCHGWVGVGQRGTLWRWTTLSQWDGVCRNASIFFYSIIIIMADVIVTMAISGSGWAAQTERQKSPNGKRRHWNSGGEYDLYNIYIYR